MTRLFWITGLAGAGKTTLARALVGSIRNRHQPIVLLDGDELREAFSMTNHHELADRLRLANSYARIARLIHSQGISVVCATISPFPEVRQWLRDHVPGYVEIFVRVSRNTLTDRDQKGLYSSAATKGRVNLVGLDIPFLEPATPDVVIDNEPGTNMADHVRAIDHFLDNTHRLSA